VWRVVALPSLQHICFFTVTFSDLCGSRSDSGLVSQAQNHLVSEIISSSLLIV